MAVILYRNVVLLVGGIELTGALHEFSADYCVEVLDQTTFGDTTRSKAAGLYESKIGGKGWFDGAIGTEQILFNEVGGNGNIATVSGALVNPSYVAGAVVQDTVLLAFPDGVTEGSLTTGMGYACKGLLETFTVGGPIAGLLDVSFAAESRGYLT